MSEIDPQRRLWLRRALLALPLVTLGAVMSAPVLADDDDDDDDDRRRSRRRRSRRRDDNDDDDD